MKELLIGFFLIFMLNACKEEKKKVSEMSIEEIKNLTTKDLEGYTLGDQQVIQKKLIENNIEEELKKIKEAKRKKDNDIDLVLRYVDFNYYDLPTIRVKGDASRGKDLVMGAGACTSCHSINIANISAPMDAVKSAVTYGVNPPDLSYAGVIYDSNFLSALIKYPVHALEVEHKFDMNKGKMHPMDSFYGAGGDLDQEVADMIAYLVSIAPKAKDLTPSMVFETACGRCHTVKSKKWTQIGTKPMFKKKRDEQAFDIDVLAYQDSLIKYMGQLPPDLSNISKEKTTKYLLKMIYSPQSVKKETSMPRVGVTKDSARLIDKYLKN